MSHQPSKYRRESLIDLYHVILTSTRIPNFIEIEEKFLWTDGRTYGRTDIRDPLY